MTAAAGFAAARRAALQVAALVAMLVAVPLPWLYARLFALDRAHTYGVWLDLGRLGLLAGLAVLLVTAVDRARDQRDDLLAFPGRAAAALAGVGTVGAAIFEVTSIVFRHLPLATAMAMALATSSLIGLGALALLLAVRRAIDPARVAFPEGPMEGRGGLRRRYGVAVVAIATTCVIPGAVLLQARAGRDLAHARADRMNETRSAIERLLPIVGAADRGALLHAAPPLTDEAPPEAGGAAFLVVVAVLLLGLGAAATAADAMAGDADALVEELRGLDGRHHVAAAGYDVEDFATLASAVNALLDRLARFEVESFVAVEKMGEGRRARAQFLANMSHDLRSPLNSILGFSELILRGMEGELAPENHRALQEIQRSGRRLLRLINEILDTARSESGRMKVQRERLLPAEVVNKSIAEGRDGHDPAPDVMVDRELQPGLAPIEADPVRLGQAITHLVGHAYDSADKGRILVRVGDRKGPTGRLFVLEVSWDGRLSPEEREALFVPFRHTSTRSGEGSLGLGVPLARRLVELHGGTLELAEGERPRLVMTVPAEARKERLAAIPLKQAPR